MPLIQQTVERIPTGAQAERLRVLASPSNVRADAIRQFHDRGLDLAEVLMDLEEDDVLRAEVIEALERLTF